MKPGDQLDRFTLVDVIGEGSAATVFVALDRMGRLVVVKLAREGIAVSPELRRRFRREAEMAKRVSHPRVQRSADDTLHRTALYTVLTYTPGRSLRQVIDEGRVDHADVRRWSRDVAEGLVAIHAAGIVHRDVKPENIIIGDDGRATLVDFGDAAWLRHRSSRFEGLTGVQGTPDYLSPEQILGGKPDPRSDLYALGTVMFEALTGRVPFDATTVEDMVLAHLQDQPLDVRVLQPGVPPDLADTIRALLRRRPEDRPRDARAVVERLEHPPALPPADEAPIDPPLRGSLTSASNRAALKLVLVTLLALAAVVLAAGAITILL
jgi:serine/threonine-protein kinase